MNEEEPFCWGTMGYFVHVNISKYFTHSRGFDNAWMIKILVAAKCDQNNLKDMPTGTGRKSKTIL